MVVELQAHPLAAVFPLLAPDQLHELAADIREHGQREPIVIFDGQVLDGRNRLQACRMADVEPRFETFRGTEQEALAFVVSLNIQRRHLNESQRAIIAARLANMRQGERTDRQPSANLRKVSTADAAAMLKVSTRSVETAKKVIDLADRSVVAAVEGGKLKVSAALVAAEQPAKDQQQFAETPKAEQRETIRAWHEARKPKAKKSKAKKQGHGQSVRSRIRANLRDGLDLILSLPSPAMVLLVVRMHDRSKGLTLEQRLSTVSEKLLKIEQLARDEASKRSNRKAA